SPQVLICASSINLHKPVETRPLRTIQADWHHSLDIGYLEIHDPGSEELSWDQLTNASVLQGQVHVVGYPTERVDLDLQRRVVLLGQNTFSTSVTEETPEYFKLNYPVAGTRYEESSGKWLPSQFPTTPDGFSGGGCFGVTKNQSGALDVIQYHLLGIQSCWMRSERYVKAIPIKQWRDLVEARFPDIGGA
ncbi:MAG TPA: hypothetical protein VGP68_24555, partial [Gemmataceae bacterium]|nr:hypothetical protein [Gemmataceae bacterium]